MLKATELAGFGSSTQSAAVPDSKTIFAAHGTTTFISAWRWSSAGVGTKYANPATTPTFNGTDIAFHKNGVEFGLSHGNSPWITYYNWSTETGFGTTLSGPASPYTGSTAAWAIDFPQVDGAAGNFVVVGLDASPYIRCNKWIVGYGALGEPTGLAVAPGTVWDCAFSPAGTELVFCHDNSPYVTGYPFNPSVPSFGTKFANPGTLPTGSGQAVSFTPTGNAVAIAHFSSPYISVYPWSTSGFGTKYANPTAGLPTGNPFISGVKFSKDGAAVIILHKNSPYISAYRWSTSGFGTKYTNPASIPNEAGPVAFSEAGGYVAMSGTSQTIYVWAWSSDTGFGTAYTIAAPGNTFGLCFGPSK